MNKILKYLKYILYVISIAFVTIFIIKYKIKFNDNYVPFCVSLIIMIILLTTTLVLNIITDVKKEKISNLNGYHLLTITNLLTLIFIYGRTNFDKNIISNALRGLAYNYYDIYGYKYCVFYSNFIILLFILNIIYFIANAKRCK